MRIGVAGCAGRMGRMLVRQVLATPGATLAGAVARPGSAAIGEDAGRLAGTTAAGVAVGDDPAALFAAAEAVIDFTSPDATAGFATLAAERGTILVAGTTGLGAAEQAALQAAARQTAIVWSANMSLGVNLLLALVEQAAARLDAAYDIEILEMHHRAKVDAPSGTALALGRAAAAGRGVRLEERAVSGRDGRTGAREAGAIGFAVLRGGDVVGEHSVVFAGPGERLELAHKAGDRAIYARGAVQAALWARGRPPGLYGMRDVLGL